MWSKSMPEQSPESSTTRPTQATSPKSLTTNRKLNVMFWLIIKALVSAAVIVTVAEISGRVPRLGALLLTLPLISILAFIMTWNKEQEMGTITALARETMVLVPLGLPFFVPFAVANRTGLSFWPTFVIGVLLASLTIGTWFWLAPPIKSQADATTRVEPCDS